MLWSYSDHFTNHGFTDKSPMKSEILKHTFPLKSEIPESSKYAAQSQAPVKKNPTNTFGGCLKFSIHFPFLYRYHAISHMYYPKALHKAQGLNPKSNFHTERKKLPLNKRKAWAPGSFHRYCLGIVRRMRWWHVQSNLCLYSVRLDLRVEGDVCGQLLLGLIKCHNTSVDPNTTISTTNQTCISRWIKTTQATSNLPLLSGDSSSWVQPTRK